MRCESIRGGAVRREQVPRHSRSRPSAERNDRLWERERERVLAASCSRRVALWLNESIVWIAVRRPRCISTDAGSGSPPSSAEAQYPAVASRIKPAGRRTFIFIFTGFRSTFFMYRLMNILLIIGYLSWRVNFTERLYIYIYILHIKWIFWHILAIYSLWPRS